LGITGDLINTTEESVNSAQMLSTSIGDLSKVQLKIGLSTDSNKNVYAVDFEVIDDKTEAITHVYVPLRNLVIDDKKKTIQVSARDIAPISGFNVVLVGQFSGTALLSVGAGTITCAADNAVIAETLASAIQLPADSDYLRVIQQNGTAAETANS
jgi:hypothetical protein